MKHSIFFLALTITASASWQVPSFPPPPGTKRIGENTFIDKSLIKYIDYEEFLHFIKKEDSELYREMLPADTLVTYKGEPLWRNKKYEEYPIVGLLENQIQQYCTWRSGMVNQLIFDSKNRCGNFDYWSKFDTADPEKRYKVVYSIPSKAEIMASSPNKEKYHPDEFARDGVVPGKKMDKLSNKTLKGFRCKATFVPIK